MDDYSPAMDSQAAYAAMPNQGLPGTSAATSGMTTQQRQQLAAQLLMKGLQANQPAPLNGVARAPAPVPTQTLNAGQMIGAAR